MRSLLYLLGAFLFLAAAAHGADDGLKPVADALAAVRATHAINKQSDAGQELTPVKQRLRKWVEKQLSSFAEHGDETALTKQLNAAIEASGLICNDDQPGRTPCIDKSSGEAMQQDARGYLGGVGLSWKGYGRYLVLTADVGVRCGYDESAYIYEWRDKRWQLLLQTEQDRYGEKEYAPQNFISIDVSPDSLPSEKPAPPPLVLTLGYSPWCQSFWQAIYIHLWRASPTNPTPGPLLNMTDTLYMGNDPAVAEGSVTQNDALIEYQGNSIDGGVFIRPHVFHYLVRDGDKLERIAPVALNPKDFVDEWLTRPWAESAQWTDSSGNTSSLGKWYRALHKDSHSALGEFDGGAMRCRADPTLWQVGFPPYGDNPKNAEYDPPVYFLVRWMAPYRFTLVGIQKQKYPNCDVEDPMPDNFGTLFPLQDWRR